MTKYKTRDLRLASYLWTQTKYPATFDGLIPIPHQPSMFWFNFVFEATQDQLDELLNEYTNEKACVEPNSYNAKMGRLRDALSSASTASGARR
jgi:hypothetical protein